MGESRRNKWASKVRLPDVIKHGRILGHGAQLQAARLAAKASRRLRSLAPVAGDDVEVGIASRTLEQQP